MEAEQPETVSLVWTNEDADAAASEGWAWNKRIGVFAPRFIMVLGGICVNRLTDEQARIRVIEQAQAGNPIAIKALKLEILRVARVRNLTSPNGAST